MSVPEKPWNAWLEDTLRYIYSTEVESMGIVAIRKDGECMTAYYNADATDKAVFAHNIQSDITMDVVMANADLLKARMEELTDGEE